MNIASDSQLFNDPGISWTLVSGSAPNIQTVDFVRQISEGKEITEDTVMMLATFLNENLEARHSWPGETLFDFLRDLLTSGGIGDSQLNATRAALNGIEREFSIYATPDMRTQAAVALDSIWVEDLKLPKLHKRVPITDAASGNSFKVDLGTHKCSCGAWYGNRHNFKNADARLCCSHIAQAFKLKLKDGDLGKSPRLFPEMIADIASRYEGLDYRSSWRLLRIQMRPFMVSYGRKVKWCTVYAHDGRQGVEKFALHRTELRWSYGRHPQCAATIAAYVKSLHAAWSDQL